MSSTTTEPNCTTCSDTGFEYLPGKERRVRRCACLGNATRRRLETVLPPLYVGAVLTDFAEPLGNAARLWLRNPSHGLLLLGPTGSGKTWLAAALVHALIDSGKSVIFKAAADFYSELRAAFNKAQVTEQEIFERLTESPFLVLDDVGAGSLSDHERRSTLHLLDRRLNHQRPTIVTTNLTIEQIGKLMDERISSRLNAFTRIAVTGRDRRAARR